jgi:hypothetical protein
MMRKKLFCLIIAFSMLFSIVACNKSTETNPQVKPGVQTGKRYEGPFVDVNGAYGGVDDLGRVVAGNNIVGNERDRKVGIFYFLWMGEHGKAGPYDNSAIVEANPDAIKSEKDWLMSGGGPQNAHHFWGEPLFGYYLSSDEWVMRKHLQMLTDAGVDFIVFDTTNGYIYDARVKELLAVWYEYLEMGVDVPQIAFYTNSNSGTTMQNIYRNFYNNKALAKKYPRLNELWYNWDGKPMLVGNVSEASDELKEFFTIKQSQWPTEGRKDNGFPWMEFSRSLKETSVYGVGGRKEVVNVSVAQHSATVCFSKTAWYGANDRTRCWHNGRNDTSKDAILYGYNFAEQWDFAIKQDPEMIFVTGWNEWVAQRQPTTSSGQIIFVDCADYNTSRDVEPTAGIFGDNYYMQMVEYIRKYKGAEGRVYVGDDQTIDINGSFAQWDAQSVTAKYRDYKNDTVDRKQNGFGKEKYENLTGRNDIVNMKVAHDKENIYFYVDTAEAITPASEGNWMSLFIDSGVDGNKNWYGYDFAVNIDAPNGNTGTLSKATGGSWGWEKAGTVQMKVEGNKLMLAIKRADLGIVENNGKPVINIQFKWADNYQKDEEGNFDIWTFYKDGDAAPYGRLNYIYSETL